MRMLIVALVLAGAAGGGWYWWSARQAQAVAAAQPAVVTAAAERATVTVRVATTGRIVAKQDVDIKCKASGEIIQLPFDVSDYVKRDALLVEVDPVYAQRSIRQAEVTLASAEAKLAKAKQSLDVDEKDLATEKLRAAAAVKSAEAQQRYAQLKAARMAQLAETLAGSREEADLTEASAVQAGAVLENARVRLQELVTLESALELKRQDVKLAEAEVEANKIRLEETRQTLADTKVVAPIDGVVTARNVQTGQIIASGISNVGGGTTVMTLSDLSQLFVLASVDESDIGQVRAEQPATITVDAFPGKRFRGKVVRIATRGVNVSNVVTFEVKIEVLGENKALLKPEMTANVEIVAAEKQDVLTVPQEALRRQKGTHLVDVLKADGTKEEREVETGLSDGTRQEIASGLAEGERVVLHKGESESRWKPGGAPSAARMMMGGGGGKR